MTNDHPFIEDIPAYVLGALDPEAVAALENHLAACETCRAELIAYRRVGHHLLTAAPPRQPPDRLRRQLQRRLPGAHTAPRPRFAWSFNRLAAGAAILLLIALNISSFVQVQNLERRQQALTRQLESDRAALALLADAQTVSIDINEGKIAGTFLLNPGRDFGLLIVSNLPQLPNDQTYQAWLIDPQGGRTSAGIFQPDPGLAYVSKGIASAVALSSYIGIGVTVEPAGGSDQPTGERVIRINF
jgi:anti-sigma-K factor RskA